MAVDESEIAGDYGFAPPETAVMDTIPEAEEPAVDDNHIAYGVYDEEDDDNAFYVPVEMGQANPYHMNVGELFGETEDMPSQTPGGSLLLPPRPMMATGHGIGENGATYGATEIPPAVQHAMRSQMAMARGTADGQQASGGISDMRLVLQMELKREEDLLKDLRAEIVDKISKLTTEERLLRMVVKHDFELGNDDVDEDLNAADITFAGGYGDVDTVLSPMQPSAMDMTVHMRHADDSDDGGDSDDSLSGMSSSTSDDEVHDDDVARGALISVLGQYLPSADAE
ncbi:hypothetical protein IWW38_000119 [Coemansia aciculifera]|uniref:Uncharacterized protein n=1 Tax=Coemansia aciculifera TaxID=417176 RepID=A0ACC1MB29_9FUNG|nr:hypothetical protein IWW38_000119 [Coemansia aciculifera]